MTTPDTNQGFKGFYRFPALFEETIIFTAEGDLWRVNAAGGLAQRLTTHHGVEFRAVVSPDGRLIAFSAQYEGATELYTMPFDGGRPRRLTFEDGAALAVGWTPGGQIIYSTRRYARLPNTQLATIDPQTGAFALIPLAQASDGSYSEDGKTLFFTRLPFQGSYTKRYKGGTVQTVWKFAEGAKEAEPLTADYPGTSKTPMWWNGRVYFASDRDGTMNLWSMDENGEDLQQHTTHKGFDIHAPQLNQGRIVYQLGADIYLYTISSGESAAVAITLASDLDHMRARWVKNPVDYLSSWDLSPKGDRVVMVSRGRVFVLPVQDGRLVEVTRESGVRYRAATFFPDGDQLLAMSDASGELEYVKLPADGFGPVEQITHDGQGFRFSPQISPDGSRFAFADKDQRLWVVQVETREIRQIAASEMSRFYHLSWSPDSRWLAFVALAENTHSQIKLYDIERDEITAVTSDRVDSYSPAWSPDGQWLYFLSDRTFNSVVSGPWGPRQPEPFLNETTNIYMMALQQDHHCPFLPDNELLSSTPSSNKDGDNKKNGEQKEEALTVQIAFDGLHNRLYELPVKPGNYVRLLVNKKAVFWLERLPGQERKYHLRGLEIKNEKIETQLVARSIKQYVLSANGEKILVRQNNTFLVFDATGKTPKSEDRKRVRLGEWAFEVDARQEWRQMFVDAWRLERDYFYDRNLHGVDWDKMLARHLPLVDRVTDRDELDHLIAQMVGELSALHTFVSDGDKRRAPDKIPLASLGATLSRDDEAGGYRVDYIFTTEPDYPARTAPLARPEVNVQVGDVILAINGISTLEVAHPAVLLRNQAGKQVRLQVKTAVSDTPVDKIAVPISTAQEASLRYDDWERLNRLTVEEKGSGQLGYIHMRAMRGDNFAEWAQNYYAVFNRAGLIIDMRHNRGGNIDSWILSRLLRQAWFYWQPRRGRPSWNMHYAFRGHLVVLCNERTSSDGEAFTEGFRRLGLGKVIGTRTWGGEIWLSRNTHLVDKGIATAAQTGVYTADGEWLIEGHGVDPDIVVDNLPHATFQGEDAQLDAAIAYLLAEIEKTPNPVPPPPPHPDKSFDYGIDS